MRRRPLLATALVIGASKGAARREVEKQAAQQEAALNTQARLQWEAQQSAARDQKIAADAARAALAGQGQSQSSSEGQSSQNQGSGKPKFCSACGYRLPETGKFCPECGIQVQR